MSTDTCRVTDTIRGSLPYSTRTSVNCTDGTIEFNGERRRTPSAAGTGVKIASKANLPESTRATGGRAFSSRTNARTGEHTQLIRIHGKPPRQAEQQRCSRPAQIAAAHGNKTLSSRHDVMAVMALSRRDGAVTAVTAVAALSATSHHAALGGAS